VTEKKVAIKEKEKKEESLEFKRQSVVLNFAQMSGMILKDLNERSQAVVKKYTKDDVKTYLDNPIRYSKELGDLSQGLYRASPHYRRLINYFSNLPTLDWIVEPFNLNLDKVNDKSFKTAWERTNQLLELMNIKHEFGKALKVAWTNDTFYGYEHEATDSYFIQTLPNLYCQISSIEDGVYNFAFNFQYFDRNQPQLEMYPKEFKKLYNKYKNGSEGQWIELDPTKTVCFKVNEHLDYDLPPFSNVFASIFDIEDYKALKKTATTVDNYKFIVQKIPIRRDSGINNDFLIDLPNMTMFHNRVASTIPDEIGLITVPFDVETIDFSRDKSDTDKIEEAEREFYSSAGTSSLLFNGNNSSQANLAKSIMVDEQEVFSLNRQIERWINRKLKVAIKGNVKFKIKLLDATIFNKEELIEKLLQSAQYGFPVKLMLASLMGVSPASVKNMAYVENTFLSLIDEFIPLQSSHTQSSKDAETTKENKDSKNGRPESNPDELSEKGEEQQNRDDNANRE
jgi:hypothetical protein